MSFFILFLSGTCSAIASLLLKVASQMAPLPIGGMPAPLVSLATVFQGGALASYGAGFILYAIALRDVKLNVAYPIMVGVTLLEILVFSLLIGESLSLKTVVGAGLLLAAIFLLHA